jgi:hypothetical protein
VKRERFDGRDREGRALPPRRVDPGRGYFWTQAEWIRRWRTLDRTQPR